MTAADIDLASVEESLTALFESVPHGDASAALDSFGAVDLVEEAGLAAVQMVFELQGRFGATSDLLDRLMVRSFGVNAPSASVLLPLSSGSFDGVAGRTVPGGIEVSGVVFGGGGGGPTAVAVRNELGDVEVHVAGADDIAPLSVPVAGLDPGLALVRVEGSVATTERCGSEDDWNGAVDVARFALASELVGCTEAMLDLAAEHARSRTQFGVPIGSFQALKHKLAEVAVAVAAARATLAAATAAPTSIGALTAKSSAGTAAHLAMSNCLQTLGGIGFTWEHSHHLWHRRALVLDRLLGSATELPAVIGQQLLTDGHLGELQPLV